MLELTIREARTSYSGDGQERRKLYKILRVEDKSARWRAIQFLRSVRWFSNIKDKKERKKRVEEVKSNAEYIKFYDKRSRTFASGLVQIVKSKYPEKIKIHDLRRPLPKFDLGFKKLDFMDEFEVRDEQLTAVRNALYNGRGILYCATNSGKTDMACGIISEFQNQQKVLPRVLYLVHRISLVKQTVERFQNHLGNTLKITAMGGGNKSIPAAGILVTTVQTAGNLLERVSFRKFLESCDMQFFDEFHINKAATATKISKFCRAPMRFGLSGTINKKSKVKMMHYTGLTGPVLAEIRNKELVEKGRSAKPYIRFIEVDSKDYDSYTRSYVKGIVRNRNRNKSVISEMLRYLNKDLKVLVTVTRIKHGLKLLHRIEQATEVRSTFMSGSTPVPVREKIIADFRSGRVPILVVSDVFSVGMDVPEIDSWINAAGGLGWELILQRLGRTLRAKKKGPNKVYVTDFIDTGNHFLFKHSIARLKAYEAEDIAEIKIIKGDRK
jgi:superfamily II DNA or RNA helicase